jgi:hypothetical protein
MTIEEKLNEFFYVPEHLKCKEADDEVQIQREAFRDGANWMLEKAMALIEDSVVFDKFGKPVKSETFRKAMEE